MEDDVQSYERIISRNLFYAAKPKFFKKLPAHCMLLCRPKRQGKTLLCSVATYFYDVRSAPHFDKMFPGEKMEEYSPSPCSFLVLNISLDALFPPFLNSPNCGLEFEQNFHDKLLKTIRKFHVKYGISTFPEYTDCVQSLIHLSNHVNYELQTPVSNHNSVRLLIAQEENS